MPSGREDARNPALRWFGFSAVEPTSRRHVLAYALAIAMVALCTFVDWVMFGRTTEPNLILVYILGLIPVALSGNIGASMMAALLAVLAFDFFFTEPFYSLSVYDLHHVFTFIVMGVVSMVISLLTAELSAKITSLSKSQAMVAQQVEELRQAGEKVQKVERLKSDLISNATHELRTPLASITGFVEFLEDQVGGPMTPQQMEFVQQIHKGASRLEQLVDRLLDFARLDAGSLVLDKQAVDLGPLVEGTVQAARPQALAAQLSLEVVPPPASMTVEVDAARLAEVLGILLDNAIKFTPPGGHVTVSMGRHPREACIEVRDTGIGISPEHQKQLFQTFYQVDPTSTRAHGGMGLGLALAKALTEAHGGHIGVRAQEEKGSTFYVCLPTTGPEAD